MSKLNPIAISKSINWLTLHLGYASKGTLLIFSFTLALITTLGSAFSVASDEANLNTNPLTAEARITPQKVSPGANVNLQIDIKLDPPFIAYADQFRVSFPDEFPAHSSPIEISPLVYFKDVVSKKMKKGLKEKGKITALLEFDVEKPIRAGSFVKLRYQACTKKFCLFPKTIEIPLSYDVVSQDNFFAASDSEKSNPVQKIQGAYDKRFSEALEKGLPFVFLLVFVFGFLTSLTPCVYPMIPITLAILGACSKGQSKLKGFTISIIYVLGIATTYTSLGIVAALTGSVFGGILGNPFAISAIAFLFFLMGLSILGAFEIQVPDKWSQKLNQSDRGGLFVPFLSGVVAGVVASPCVGPVLFSILAFISQTQDVVLGGFLLFTFALGLGVLFIILGTFSQLINKVPKSGPWMESIKFIFGVAMFATALYFVEPIYPVWLWNLLAGFMLVGLASVYGAFDKVSGKGKSAKLKKGIMLGVLILGLAFLLKSIYPISASTFTGKAGYEPSTKSSQKINWQDYSKELIEIAKKQKRPVFIDFYADWCAACVQMVRTTFKDPTVIEETKRFIAIKVDNTNSTPLGDKALKDFGVVSLPTFIFIDSNGKVVEDLTLREFEDAELFVNRLKKLN